MKLSTTSLKQTLSFLMLFLLFGISGVFAETPNTVQPTVAPSMCIPSQKVMINAAAENGEHVAGAGWETSPFATERGGVQTFFLMNEDHRSATFGDWSFLSTSLDHVTGKHVTCLLEGGEKWVKIPYKPSEKFIFGEGFKEKVNYCASLPALTQKLALNRKFEIGKGERTFEPSPSINSITVHFFVAKTGTWTVVDETFYTGQPGGLACIVGTGSGMMFQNYYK